MIISAIGFATALMVGLAVTPLVRRYALQAGFLDRPDRQRKMHDDPVPIGGGIAVWLALLSGVAAVLVATPFLSGFKSESAPGQMLTLGILIATSFATVCLGVWDDRVHLRGRHKLMLQALIAGILIVAGWQVESISILGMQFSLRGFGGVFCLMWILGSTNSFNLIDGVDGLASIVGIVLSLALGAVALLAGEPFQASLAFALAGALIGFLPFNFVPATIYLGDAGSMLIGFLLGALALSATTKEAATIAAAPLLGMWTILILDSGAAFLRRSLTGRSIYVGDRGHIHHRLLTRGLSPVQTVLALGGLCAVTSGAAVLSLLLNLEIVGLLVAAGVVIGLAMFRFFGHSELGLLVRRLARAGRSAMRPVTHHDPNGKSANLGVALQGDARWDDVWYGLTQVTEKYDLMELRLNLYIPTLHENYYADWQSPQPFEPERVWRVDRPLVCDGLVIGNVVARGRTNDTGGSAGVIDFLEYAESLDEQIFEISQKIRYSAAAGEMPEWVEKVATQ